MVAITPYQRLLKEYRKSTIPLPGGAPNPDAGSTIFVSISERNPQALKRFIRNHPVNIINRIAVWFEQDSKIIRGKQYQRNWTKVLEVINDEEFRQRLESNKLEYLDKIITSMKRNVLG